MCYQSNNNKINNKITLLLCQTSIVEPVYFQIKIKYLDSIQIGNNIIVFIKYFIKWYCGYNVDGLNFFEQCIWKNTPVLF